LLTILLLTLDLIYLIFLLYFGLLKLHYLFQKNIQYHSYYFVQLLKQNLKLPSISKIIQQIHKTVQKSLTFKPTFILALLINKIFQFPINLLNLAFYLQTVLDPLNNHLLLQISVIMIVQIKIVIIVHIILIQIYLLLLAIAILAFFLSIARVRLTLNIHHLKLPFSLAMLQHLFQYLLLLIIKLAVLLTIRNLKYFLKHPIITAIYIFIHRLPNVAIPIPVTIVVLIKYDSRIILRLQLNITLLSIELIHETLLKYLVTTLQLIIVIIRKL